MWLIDVRVNPEHGAVISDGDDAAAAERDGARRRRGGDGKTEPRDRVVRATEVEDEDAAARAHHQPVLARGVERDVQRRVDGAAHGRLPNATMFLRFPGSKSLEDRRGTPTGASPGGRSRRSATARPPTAASHLPDALQASRSTADEKPVHSRRRPPGKKTRTLRSMQPAATASPDAAAARTAPRLAWSPPPKTRTPVRVAAAKRRPPASAFTVSSQATRSTTAPVSQHPKQWGRQLPISREHLN